MSLTLACGKRRHATREAAESAAFSLTVASTKRKRCRAYRCPLCGSFHTTSLSKRQMERRGWM